MKTLKSVQSGRGKYRIELQQNNNGFFDIIHFVNNKIMGMQCNRKTLKKAEQDFNFQLESYRIDGINLFPLAPKIHIKFLSN